MVIIQISCCLAILHCLIVLSFFFLLMLEATSWAFCFGSMFCIFLPCIGYYAYQVSVKMPCETQLMCIAMEFGMEHATCYTQAEGVLPLGPFQRRFLCWAAHWHSLRTPWYPLAMPRYCCWLHTYVGTTACHPCRGNICCYHMSNGLVLIGELAHVCDHALRMSEVLNRIVEYATVVNRPSPCVEACAARI